MPDDQLTNFSPINQDDLPHNDYLLALLNRAAAAQLISATEVKLVESQIMDLLKDVMIQYTCGESTSLRVETAQMLLASILYCLDVYCLSLESPQGCIEELRTRPVPEIYLAGLALVKSFTEESCQLLKQVQASRVHTKLIAYNSTLDALPGFFKHYDYRFNAHDTCADIDYPLAHDAMNTRGILYIKKYISNLDLENQFCAHFRAEDTERLLKSYGIIYRIDYAEFLLNIFEIVLTNAVFAVMLGQGAKTLAISVHDCSRLHFALNRLTVRETTAVFEQAVNRLIAELEITDAELIAYIRLSQKNIIPRLNQALQHHSLDKLLITVQPVNQSARVTWQSGTVLTDNAFRDLLQQLKRSTDSSEKTGLLLGSVNSLTDFVDVLESDSLDKSDYQSLYQRLGDLELALLLKTTGWDHFRDQDAGLFDQLIRRSGEDREWVLQLLNYLPSLDAKRREAVLDLVVQLTP